MPDNKQQAAINNLEAATQIFNFALNSIMEMTKALSCNFNPLSGNLEVHICGSETFDSIAAGREITVERRRGDDYPFQKMFLVNGIKFFCLQKLE
jgi:hypothetical protein